MTESTRKFIPGFFTSLNLFAGFLSVIQSMGQDFLTAAWLIVVAVLCDGLDGKFARATGSESYFGSQMDSLADVVASGLAPAVLVQMAMFEEMAGLGLVMSFIYLFAAATRLARHNSLHQDLKIIEYEGLPVPVCGMTVASFWIFLEEFGWRIPPVQWMVLLSVFSVLMVSRVPYRWPKIFLHGSTKRIFVSVVFLLVSLAMIVYTAKVLFVIMALYIIILSTNSIILRILPKQSTAQSSVTNK
jgi:CDP-diacylglycerol--serine O-phosphatidyltransferase